MNPIQHATSSPGAVCYHFTLLFSSSTNKRLAKTGVIHALPHMLCKIQSKKRGIEVDINYTCELIKHYHDRFFRKAIFIVWYMTCSWLWAFRNGEMWAVLSGCIPATQTDRGTKFIPNTGTQLKTRPQFLRHSLCSSVSTVASVRDKGPTNLGSIFGSNRDLVAHQSVWIFSGNPLSRANAKQRFFLWRYCHRVSTQLQLNISYRIIS